MLRPDVGKTQNGRRRPRRRPSHWKTILPRHRPRPAPPIVEGEADRTGPAVPAAPFLLLRGPMHWLVVVSHRIPWAPLVVSVRVGGSVLVAVVPWLTRPPNASL